MDEELRLGVELALVREALKPDLVQRLLGFQISNNNASKEKEKRSSVRNREKRRRTHIGGVADKLAKEDLLVGVEGVDDQAEELVNLRLEGEGLRLGRHSRREKRFDLEESLLGK